MRMVEDFYLCHTPKRWELRWTMMEHGLKMEEDFDLCQSLPTEYFIYLIFAQDGFYDGVGSNG